MSKMTYTVTLQLTPKQATILTEAMEDYEEGILCTRPKYTGDEVEELGKIVKQAVRREFWVGTGV